MLHIRYTSINELHLLIKLADFCKVDFKLINNIRQNVISLLSRSNINIISLRGSTALRETEPRQPDGRVDTM